MHGGKSTGPPPGSTNAARPGDLYSRFLTAEEKQCFDSVRIGQVDAELRLMRIRLMRALASEHAAAGQPELDEVIEREQGGEAVSARRETKSKMRDYVGIIDKTTARIESLERTRITLRADGGGGEDDPVPGSLTQGTPDEAIPDQPIR